MLLTTDIFVSNPLKRLKKMSVHRKISPFLIHGGRAKQAWKESILSLPAFKTFVKGQLLKLVYTFHFEHKAKPSKTSDNLLLATNPFDFNFVLCLPPIHI